MGRAVGLLLVLLVVHSYGRAADLYYDSVAGSDGNPCTLAEPCQTYTKLSADFAAATCGDALFLKRGSTWTASTSSHGLNRSDLACTSDNRLTVQAYSTGDRPILNNSASGLANVLGLFNVSWVDVSGLHLIGKTRNLLVGGGSNITFDDMELEDAVQECVHFRRRTTNAASTIAENITLTDSIIHDCVDGELVYIGVDPAQNGGVPDTSKNITISNNELYGGIRECIEMKSGTQNVTVEYNYIHDTTRSSAQNGCLFSSRASGIPAGNHIIRRNIISRSAGTGGYAIRIRNDATITENIIIDSSQHGILMEDPNNLDYVRVVQNNTLYSNAGTGVSHVAGDNDTITGNIAWANGSGNDASDPLFVSATDNGADDDNLRLQAGSPVPTNGALVFMSMGTFTIAGSGTSVVLTTVPKVSPILDCSAQGTALTLTCSGSGTVQSSVCSASGTDVTFGLPSAIQQGETCTADLTATVLLDSANIGGTAFTGVKNGTNFVLDDQAMANGSTQGETAENLLTLSNHVDDSDNFHTPSRGWENLLDPLPIADETDSAYTQETTFFVEHCAETGTWDVGNLQVYPDDDGNAVCLTLDVQTRTEIAGALTLQVDDANCNFDRLNPQTYAIDELGIKCVKITYTGNVSGGVQVSRHSLFRTPQVLPSPGPRLVTMRGGTMRGGCVGGC
jgi:hypothetical protein